MPGKSVVYTGQSWIAVGTPTVDNYVFPPRISGYSIAVLDTRDNTWKPAGPAERDYDLAAVAVRMSE
jgi:hypothetical protein